MQWLVKRPMPPNAFGADDLPLEVTYRYWHDRRREGRLPARSEIDTPEFRLVVRDVLWVDMQDPAQEGCWPLGRLAGFEEAVPRRAPSGPASGTDLRLGSLLRQDYRTVRFTGSALFQELVVATGPLVETYRELIVPLADDGVGVTELLVLSVLHPSAPAMAI